jgi:hypothetical protein
MIGTSKLAEEEDEDVFMVDFEVVEKTMEKKFIAIGHYLCTEVYNAKSLFISMRRGWQLQGGMWEKNISDNRFIIEFRRAGDFKHVLKGGPWKD